jgi:hypothetical protein
MLFSSGANCSTVGLSEMEIQISDSARIDDLVRFLWDRGLIALHTGNATVEIFDPSGPPGGESPAIERALADWRAADSARA